MTLYCVLRKLAWIGSPLLAVGALLFVGFLASAHAQTCTGPWRIVVSSQDAESLGYENFAGVDAPGFCAAYSGFLSGLTEPQPTLNSCTAEGTSARSTATPLVGTFAGVAVSYTWERQGCEGPPGGVEFVATVANPAPTAVLVAMVAGALALLWWVMFK